MSRRSDRRQFFHLSEICSSASRHKFSPAHRTLGGLTMRRAFTIVLAGLGAVTLTGAAVAASRDSHTMTVPLPDGSSVRIDYVGNVAPKVSVTPAALSGPF